MLRYPLLDRAKLVAAFLVIAIHTGPLQSYSSYGDFVVTRIAARLAVPFFFATAGFLLYRKLYGLAEDGVVVRRYAGRVLLLYAGSTLLYLPLMLYAGYLSDMHGVRDVLRVAVFDGTFYHLWYLPALAIGVLLVYALSRRLSAAWAVGIASVLYLAGLLGDSYYGLAASAPALDAFYDSLFGLFTYTRNGLFFAPLYLALGLLVAEQTRARTRPPARAVWIGLAVSVVLMSVEAILLRTWELPRHDSMYVFLAPAVYCGLLALTRRSSRASGKRGMRDVSLWIYLLHPLVIVLVRGLAELLGAVPWLVTDSMLHYVAVAAGSWTISILAVRWWPAQARKGPSVPRSSRAWKEIDLGRLRHNLAELRRAVRGDCQVMAVVKAEAYGHGGALAARWLQGEGVREYAVACMDEAIALRKQGVRGDILILGRTSPERYRELIRYRLQQTVVDAEDAVALSRYGRTITVQVKLDTGMHRLGESTDRFERVLSIYRLPHLRIAGTYTHLGSSDRLEQTDEALARAQVGRFDAVVARLRGCGIDPGLLHVQSSYGIVNYPELSYDRVRPGIALYGALSTREPVRQALDLRPVLALRARVSTVRQVARGEQIGYGSDCRAAADRLVAIVSIGYADGVPRVYADGGRVLVRGAYAPIVGRICMDHLSVDVTGREDIHPGDPVTLIGRDGAHAITVEEVAERCGTIANELLSRIGRRLDCMVHPPEVQDGETEFMVC
ncbi:serine racemase VanT catalytic subunit [Paenibacillus sp. IB182496]|uniref:Alanine racemase n=1 Tax=Paenibacillus sabuli TaxID=2772509 RepID=A0A927BQ25_9BACL|nr:serine racemase VanT catalytic subunit [Paenibacillus sabuli]MBD2843595.1 serine racemase VanT catalytic subunit [Paenibacillus sabuli]